MSTQSESHGLCLSGTWPRQSDRKAGALESLKAQWEGFWKVDHCRVKCFPLGKDLSLEAVPGAHGTAPPRPSPASSGPA